MRWIYSLLASNLVSLWVRHRYPWSPDLDPNYFKYIILHAPGVKFLELALLVLYGNFTFEVKERFPPFEKLILHSYRWIHFTQEALNHWDWSHLTRLHLENLSVYNFLRSML